MALTKSDLQEVRDVVRSVVSAELEPIHAKLDHLTGRVEALENDIKEIYRMLHDLQAEIGPRKEFKKLNLEEKLLKLNDELLATAKQAGITLPR